MAKSQAIKLEVFVASPGDVPEERNAAKQVIEEIEATLGPDLGIHLTSFLYEYDLGPGAHPLGPQGWIDAQSNLKTCDVLVGIFWNRLGTPTPDGATGTEHEFRTSFERWKKENKPHLMLYFSKQEIALTDENVAQGKMLLEFQKTLPQEVFPWRYESPQHFQKLFRQHLTKHLMRVWREFGQPMDRIRFATGDLRLAIASTSQDIIQTNIDICLEAEEFFFATGSRARDDKYLLAIEKRLKEAPKLVHHRVLMGPPFRPLLKDHLLRVLEIRPPNDRSFGYQSSFLGVFDKLQEQAEVFMTGNEKRALIVPPSRQSLGGYNTALVVDERSYVRDWYNFVKQLYAASRQLTTPEDVRGLSTVLNP